MTLGTSSVILSPGAIWSHLVGEVSAIGKAGKDLRSVSRFGIITSPGTFRSAQPIGLHRWSKRGGRKTKKWRWKGLSKKGRKSGNDRNLLLKGGTRKASLEEGVWIPERGGSSTAK